MKLLLQLTFLCLFTSSSMMAQQTTKSNNSTTKKIQRKGPKVSKNNAVIRINEVPSNRVATVTKANRNSARKQRIVETSASRSRKSLKKASHREMIAKRKKIIEKY